MTMRTMQLWKFPNPWDYHQQGAYVVAAESREDAIAILEAEAQRTGVLEAGYRQRSREATARIFGGESPKFSDPRWAEWRSWLEANPQPDVVTLPSKYKENVQSIGLVYEDSGCDD